MIYEFKQKNSYRGFLTKLSYICQMAEILILILSIAAGSILGYFFSRKNLLSKFLLTFSGAYFLGITVLEIFPGVYEGHSHTIGLFVLGGVLFQIIVESLSKGAEHGHVHLHKNQKIPGSMILGLFLHSFFEGMPVGHQHSDSLLWAIVVHNIPISMLLFGALSQMTESLWKKALFLGLFAIAGPLGVIFGDTALAEYHKEAAAFVAGIFLHIATVILFESTDSHKFKTQKIVTLLLGFVIAYLTVYLGH